MADNHTKNVQVNFAYSVPMYGHNHFSLSTDVTKVFTVTENNPIMHAKSMHIKMIR
jgi:hypothetical protein